MLSITDGIGRPTVVVVAVLLSLAIVTAAGGVGAASTEVSGGDGDDHLAASVNGPFGAESPQSSTALPRTDTAPSADWWYTPRSPQAGEPVTMIAAERADSDLDFQWTIDGDDESTGAILTHTFESAGEYEVVLQVTDGEGVTDTRSETVEVSEAVEGAATAGERDRPTFWYSPFDPRGNETVTLVAEPGGSTDDVDAFEWDLTDDGTVDDRGRIITYTYEPDGEDRVTLTVQRADGTTETVTRTVTGDGTSDEGSDSGDQDDDTAEDGDDTGFDGDGLDGTPGFGPAVAVLALLLAAVAMVRRTAEDPPNR